MYVSLPVKYPLFLPVFNELEFFSLDFENNSNIKYHECPYIGSRVVPCGWTDRRDEDNSPFSQFCERA